MFGADWLIFVDATVYSKSNSAIFSNLRANNSKFPCPIIPTIKLIRDLLVLTDLYLQILDCKQSQIWQFSNSRTDNSNSSGPIRPIIELIEILWSYSF